MPSRPPPPPEPLPPPPASIGHGAPEPEPQRRAREDEPDHGALSLSIATYVPMSIGPELYVRPPLVPLFLRAYVGWSPEPYVAAIDDVLVDARAYDRALSVHVRSIATGTTVASISLGVAYDMFDLAAGYTLLHRTPTIARELVTRVVGQGGVAASVVGRRLPESFPAELMVHMVHVELGARIVALDHLVLRLGVRWDHAVAASADVSIDTGGEVALERAVADAEREAGERLAALVLFPSLAVALGYQF